MAKRKPPAEDRPIRFENLDGSADDDADDKPDIAIEPDEDDEPPVNPRASDPFADLDDDADDVDPVAPDPDDDPDPPAPAAAAAEPAPKPDKPAEPDPRDVELERLRRELEEQRRGRDESDKAAREARVKKIDSDLDAARKALKVAIEEGETDKHTELLEQISDLKAEKRELDRAPAQPQPQPANDIEARNPAAAAWMQGKSWINNPAHRQANQYLLRVAEAMVEIDGYDPTATDYYEELDRRMKRRYPSLFPAAATQPKVERKPAHQRVAPVSRDDPPRPAAAGKRGVVLTAEDQRNMMRFGLDPHDKQHLREYARNKAKENDRVSA